MEEPLSYRMGNTLRMLLGTLGMMAAFVPAIALAWWLSTEGARIADMAGQPYPGDCRLVEWQPGPLDVKTHACPEWQH